ncbi:MAG: glycerophosphodiester phosphodiesterase [Acidobacteria bacterium]|nr:glycerophosphodiester phosphodiesterase [Acidobacteriota bacterium]
MKDDKAKRPMNLAHRGARKVAPENTLAAFIRAQELGADGVELDVFLCASGEIVVTHDDDLSILTSTTGRVSTSPLQLLKELDFGSRFSLEFKGEQIPTLQEVIDSLSKTMFVNIEIKTLSLRPVAEVLAVSELISKNNLYNRVIVSSFNPLVLHHLKKLAPNIAKGLLFEFHLPAYVRSISSTVLKLQALHPNSKLIDKKFMAKARQFGYLINTWTVNEIEEMRQLIHLGVDAIITDYPDRLKQIFLEEKIC